MKVIIWHQSANFEVFKRAFGALNRVYDKVELLGMTSHLPPPAEAAALYKKGLKPIDKNELKTIEHDMILVCGKDASPTPVLQEADSLGIDADKIVLDRTVCVPGFSIDRYKQLRRSKLSILSRNCWGGFVSHTFGLPFLSPTVNMFTSEASFIKFLRAPKEYLASELQFVEARLENNVNKIIYPVMRLNDIDWHMNHYTTVEDAVDKWTKRCARINWSNILAVMYTENPEVLAEFDQLPLEKKVCFVPFETKLDSGYRIPPKFVRGQPFWRPLNDTARNKVQCFNLWDILLYGKKTPLKT